MDLGNRLRSSVAALGVSALLLAGCGGGHGSSAMPSVPGSGGGAGSNPSSVAVATATFHFSFPKPTSSKARVTLGSRAPKYLSSATKSVSLQVTDTKNAQTNADIFTTFRAD